MTLKKIVNADHTKEYKRGELLYWFPNLQLQIMNLQFRFLNLEWFFYIQYLANEHSSDLHLSSTVHITFMKSQWLSMTRNNTITCSSVAFNVYLSFKLILLTLGLNPYICLPNYWNVDGGYNQLVVSRIKKTIK